MWQMLIGKIWRGTPLTVRRFAVRLTQPRFRVTAGAVVCDERQRILLLRHVLRKGSGWGIPGGFVTHGEHPDEALRRELREETGLELKSVELAFVHTIKHIDQVEIIFLGRVGGDEPQGRPHSFEITQLAWFAVDSLPRELGPDQRRIIERALNGRC